MQGNARPCRVRPAVLRARCRACGGPARALSNPHRRRYRCPVPRSPAKVRFKARLQRPAQPKGAAWTFVVLPAAASAKLPARGMVTVDGTLEGHAFQATLQPDGEGSHWFKVERALREAAGVGAGEQAAIELAPVAEEPEPTVPADLRAALSGNAAAQATWADITAVARRDWIHWITSGKKSETRTNRIAVACDKLASGSRHACCFDRSGIYSKGSMGAPEAALQGRAA